MLKYFKKPKSQAEKFHSTALSAQNYSFSLQSRDLKLSFDTKIFYIGSFGWITWNIWKNSTRKTHPAGVWQMWNSFSFVLNKFKIIMHVFKEKWKFVIFGIVTIDDYKKLQKKKILKNQKFLTLSESIPG